MFNTTNTKSSYFSHTQPFRRFFFFGWMFQPAGGALESNCTCRWKIYLTQPLLQQVTRGDE